MEGRWGGEGFGRERGGVGLGAGGGDGACTLVAPLLPGALPGPPNGGSGGPVAAAGGDGFATSY